MRANLATLFSAIFPSTTGQRGFYATFTPASRASSIDPMSPLGEELINELGLVIENGHIVCSYDSDIVVEPLLLRLGGTIFAGYWHGDGAAIAGYLGDPIWSETVDVKDGEGWSPLRLSANLRAALEIFKTQAA